MLWAFEQWGIVPDILLLGKALGGGLPLGAFISSNEKMELLSENPVLGHITTFGGHPLSCAAGMAAMNALLAGRLTEDVDNKAAQFHELLVHPKIKAVRSAGLLMCIELESADEVLNALQHCLAQGLFSDWFLFAPHCIRIAPPLTISEDEIQQACRIILDAIGA